MPGCSWDRALPALVTLLLLPGVREAAAQAGGAPPAAAADSAKPVDPAYREHYAPFDSVRVHYLSTGRGTNAIVFLHNWRGDVSYWTKQIAAFPDRRVIAIDLLGHGASDQPRVDYTMDYFARSIDAVLRDAGVQRAVLVGHQMGALVGRQFYRLFPEKTAGLVLVETSLREQYYPPDLVLRDLRTSFYYRWSPGTFFGRLPLRDLALEEHLREVMRATPRFVAISAMEGVLDSKIYRRDAIDVPVLAILARGTVPNDYDNFHRKLARRLEVRTIPSIYDMVMISEPELFNEALREFVAAHGLLEP